MTVLVEITRQINTFKEKVALIHHRSLEDCVRYTFGDLELKSAKLASVLFSAGLQPGQFVGIFMQRCPEHILSMLAIMKCGAAFFSLNPKLSLQQVAHALSTTKSPILLIDNSALIKLSNQKLDQLPGVRFIHYTDEPMKTIHKACLAKLKTLYDIESINSHIPDAGLDFSPPTITGQDVALVLFTSGSTGLPKGVMISHQDLYNRVLGETRDFRLTASDRLLNLLPFSFDVGLNQLFTSLVCGAQLIILNSWLPADIATAIFSHHITGISGVPSIWLDCLANETPELKASFEKLRYLTISGGDMSLNQLKQLQRLAPQTGIFKTYGQTEAFRAGILFPEQFDEKMTSVGKAVAGTDIFIINSKGKRAAPNEIGQIIHKGDGIMIGYVGDQQSTAKKLKPHPFYYGKVGYSPKVIFTGDIGKMDEDGYLYVLSRKDKMIKIRGNRIYPKEIADVIQSHELVHEAVVFSHKTETGEATIVTEIRLKNGVALTTPEMVQFLSLRLPSYMIPERFVFVDSFPRTPSGKIKLSAVEEKYNTEAN